MSVKKVENAGKEVRAMARTKKYKRVEDLEKKIEEYFQKCDKEKEPYTISGLALALDFDSRQSLLNYCNYRDENDEKYLDTIKRAKARCESSVECGLLSGRYNATGAIFNLKNNFGWKDKQEIENQGEQTLTIKIGENVKEWGG